MGLLVGPFMLRGMFRPLVSILPFIYSTKSHKKVVSAVSGQVGYPGRVKSRVDPALIVRPIKEEFTEKH